jgi:hypothetical protein
MKRLLTFLLLLISLYSRAQVTVVGTIIPASGGTFPVVADTNIWGGMQVVVDLNARNNIPTLKRKEGMLVCVVAQSDSVYQLIGGIDNTDWKPCSLTVDTSLIATKLFVQSVLDDISFPVSVRLQFLTSANQTSYTSSYLINDSIVSVSINGIDLYQNDTGSMGYSYNPITGTITFNLSFPAYQKCVVVYNNSSGVLSTSNYYSKPDLENLGTIVPVISYSLIAAPISSPVVLHTTGGFTGWGSTIGLITGFNELVYMYGTQTTPVTQIARSIRIDSAGGPVVYSDTVNVTTTANGVFYDTIKLPFTYEGSDTLYFQFLTNQLSNEYGVSSNLPLPSPPYDSAKYFTNFTLNLSQYKHSTNNENLWYEALSTSTTYQPSEEWSDKTWLQSDSSQADHNRIENISNTLNNLPNVVDSLLQTNNIISLNNIYSLIAAPISGGSWLHTTGGFTGWGSSVGPITNFNRIIYKFQTQSTPVTQVSHCIRIDSANGPIIYADTENIRTSANSIIMDTFKLPFTYTGHDTLYFQFLTNQLSNEWGINSSLPFPNPPYGSAYYYTNFVLNLSATKFSTGNENLWYEALYDTIIAQPSKSFSNNIWAQSDSIQKDHANLDSIYFKAYSGLTVAYIPNSSYSPYGNTSPTLIENVAGFTGWVSPQGNPGSFNAIKIILSCYSGASSPITASTVCIMDSTYNGNLLDSVTITGLNISPGQSDTLTFVMHDTINPVHSIFVSFAANSQVALNGFSSTYFPTPTWPPTHYYTHANYTIPPTYDSTTWGKSTSQYNIWTSFSLGSLQGVPSSNSIKYLEGILNISVVPPPLGSLITAQFTMPSSIYASTGTEINQYWDGVIYANVPTNFLTYKVVSNYGSTDRSWRYTANVGDTGSSAITFKAYLGNPTYGSQIANKICTLYVSTPNSGKGKTRKVLTMGDSQTQGDIWPQVMDSCTSPLITQYNVAYGGYEWSDFTTSGRTLYRYYVHGVSVVPSGEPTYSTNSSSYEFTETNITGGIGYMTGIRTSGTNNPLASGTLTKVSGTGDNTITYDSIKVISGNPLWDSVNNIVSFPFMENNQGFTLDSTSLICIMLGTNDYFTSGRVTDAQTIIYIDTFIAAAQRAHGHIGIAIMLPPSGSDYQSAFATLDGNSQTLTGFRSLILHYDSVVISNFDNSTYKLQNIYVLPTNGSIDLMYNMQHTTSYPNARNNTDTITVGTNDVHPSNNGYWQIGDEVYAFIKWYYSFH